MSKKRISKKEKVRRSKIRRGVRAYWQRVRRGLSLNMTEKQARKRAVIIATKEKAKKESRKAKGRANREKFFSRWKTYTRKAGRNTGIKVEKKRGKKKWSVVESAEYFRIYEGYYVSEYRIPANIMTAENGRSLPYENLVQEKIESFLKKNGLLNSRYKYGFSFGCRVYGTVRTKNREYDVMQYAQTDDRGAATWKAWTTTKVRHNNLMMNALDASWESDLYGLSRKIYAASGLSVRIEEIIVYVWKGVTKK